jgi:hypothetical protein
LRFSASVSVPDVFVLLLTRNGKIRRQCEVAWRADKKVGVRFAKSQTPAAEAMTCVAEALARIAAATSSDKKAVQGIELAHSGPQPPKTLINP